MTAESTTVARWDELHRDKRHRLTVPSEHVLRWLSTLRANPISQALDIGSGHGRHVAVLRGHGFHTFGVDLADKALPGVIGASMTSLPFRDEIFDAVLAFNVFYYGSPDDMAQAFREMHRVMRPGGHGFVTLRSMQDWRARFTGGGRFVCVGEPEHGMEMTFVGGHRLAELTRPFSEVEVNLALITTHDGARMNADWLVQVRK